MSKVNPKDLGQSVPKVEWDDLEEDVAVLTISGFDQQEVDDAEKPDGTRLDAWIMFEETGDKRLYLNVTQMERLVDEFGDETDDWMGQKCPVERVKKMFGKKGPFKKVWVVVDADEFREYAGPPKRRRAKKKATKKKGGRGK